MLKSTVILWLLAVTASAAQSGWFQPSLLERPDVRTALQSVDDRTAGIVDEWIKLTEMPAPTGQEQARAAYIRAEMQQLGLSDIRTDDISNVSGVRGHGRRTVGRLRRAHRHRVSQGHGSPRQARGRHLCAHPASATTPGTRWRRSRCSARSAAAASRRKAISSSPPPCRRRPGCWAPSTGSRRAATSRTCSSPSISRRMRSGTARCASRSTSFSTHHRARTRWRAAAVRVRREPSPGRSRRFTAFHCLPVAAGLDTFKLPVINAGTLGGGTVINAVPREAWFTVDLRSLDTATQDRLERAVVSAARRDAAEQNGVGFRMEQNMGIDYSKARPAPERLQHPLVQAALAIAQPLPQAWHAGDRPRRHRVD